MPPRRGKGPESVKSSQRRRKGALGKDREGKVRFRVRNVGAERPEVTGVPQKQGRGRRADGAAGCAAGAGRSRDPRLAAASAEARGGDRRRTREPGSWVSGGTRTVPMGFRRAGTGEACEAVRGQSGPHWKGADWEKPGASQRPPEPTVGRRRPRGERGPRLPPRPLDPATHTASREGEGPAAPHTRVGRATSREAAGGAPARGDTLGQQPRRQATREPAGPRPGTTPEPRAPRRGGLTARTEA